MIRFLGYLWALPNTLLGVLMALTVYFPKMVRWRDGALEIVPRRRNLIGGPWVGAQTYGWIIFGKTREMLDAVDLYAHERVHVDQGLKYGITLWFVYGAQFADKYFGDAKTTLWARTSNGWARNLTGLPRWRRAYYLIPLELEAYAAGYEAARDAIARANAAIEHNSKVRVL